MMMLDADLLGILDELLPARFGGDPTCYQLVEESESGQAQLRLLVHPRLGPLDELALAETFLSAIGQLSPAARVLELQWREAGLLQVERCPPLTTAVGKISHLHRRAATLATESPRGRVAR
jgi:hypothetical protein